MLKKFINWEMATLLTVVAYIGWNVIKDCSEREKAANFMSKDTCPMTVVNVDGKSVYGDVNGDGDADIIFYYQQPQKIEVGTKTTPADLLKNRHFNSVRFIGE